MSDLTDVANELVKLIEGIAYPNGIALPSIGNCPILIYQGWPDPSALTADLPNGKVHISVFPRPGDKITSVIMGDSEWQTQSSDGTTGVSIREVRRQTRTFQITIWASCFDRRDPIASIIDSSLAVYNRLVMSDGSQGIMSYVNSVQDDASQKQGIYRRDLFYAVNYATTQIQDGFVIKQVQTNVTMGPLVDAVGPTNTINT